MDVRIVEQSPSRSSIINPAYIIRGAPPWGSADDGGGSGAGPEGSGGFFGTGRDSRLAPTVAASPVAGAASTPPADFPGGGAPDGLSVGWYQRESSGRTGADGARSTLDFLRTSSS